jgi:hypothetical protein
MEIGFGSAVLSAIPQQQCAFRLFFHPADRNENHPDCRQYMYRRFLFDVKGHPVPLAD